MEKSMKIKLSAYGLISAAGFTYLMLVDFPGISVAVYAVLQFVSIFYVTRNREEVKNAKALYMFVPIFILSLNYYISGSFLWALPNMLCILLLYSSMILIMTDNFPIRELSLKFIFNILEHVFVPLKNFSVPFKWIGSYTRDDDKKQLHRRIWLGILISLPCVIFLLMMLSSADMVFSSKVDSTLGWFFDSLNIDYMFRAAFGALAGLYLFSLLYIVFEVKNEAAEKNKLIMLNEVPRPMSKDTVVINILMFSILTVYTLFIFIQFKYLFAGSSLPDNMNYSEYARRGFFELIFLSILNVGLILMTVYLFKENIYVNKDKWSTVTKICMMYLCAVTFIMLVSSFYRMYLYDQEYGFTRLRVLVYGFLIFETVGLFMTLLFVNKPRFNIVAVYTLIGLCYYLCLNVIPIDYVIAKRNVDMYLTHETKSIDIDYLMSLSVDAAPQIWRLKDNMDADIMTRYKTDQYFENIREQYADRDDWRSSNYAVERALKITGNIVSK